MSQQHSLQTGFGIIHSNKLEVLADALIHWMQQEPLAPLEKETILVQSNGMADWLKLRMVEQTGVAATLDFPLPATFLWRLYRQTLGEDADLSVDPFAKHSLEWRIYRLLPQLIKQDGFSRPAQFLWDKQSARINPVRHYQLAHRLADLYDQYQLYRGSWLRNWRGGKAVAASGADPIWQQDERWQRQLWQVLVADIEQQNSKRTTSRADLHARFIHHLEQAADQGQIMAGLPRRLFLFGINSLPAQLLDALYKLSRHTQVFLLILNPCQEFWQQQGTAFLPTALLQDESIQLTNTLLNSWGNRGRDFMRLLAQQEDHQPETFRRSLEEIRAFVSAGEVEVGQPSSLPLAIQDDILNNQQPGAQALPVAHAGLSFLPAYSRQREVEVLHDQLLGLFNQSDNDPLSYRDVIVMVPDIDDYAPHIRAVFNREVRFVDGKTNPRHLDYSISDSHPVTHHPLYRALEYLLHLPDARFTQSEIVGLLELPALCAAQSISTDDVDQLLAWMQAGFIRWGLDGEQKRALLKIDEGEAQTWRNNTWQQGMDRLLAGYCAGDADVWGTGDMPVINGLAIDEVNAGQGELLGKFVAFLQHLADFRKRLQKLLEPSRQDQKTDSWQQVFSELMATFFVPDENDEEAVLALLKQALVHWLDACELAAFDQAIPLQTARSGWLNQVEQTGMASKMRFNGISFCTLLPMRALPFKHIFLLGMNDGDYPRQQIVPDFDLMQADYQPGDRDRRGDDQYLFLEALLSVRKSLTISWIGKDISDGSDKQPSTLVSQLRDYVDQRWRSDRMNANGEPVVVSQLLTQHYPLAAFSRSYFDKHSSVRTFASGWRQLYAQNAAPENTVLSAMPVVAKLDLYQLVNLLKNPVKLFYQQRLQVNFREAKLASEDEENFALDGLGEWQLRDMFLHADADQSVDKIHTLATRNGMLPPGAFADNLAVTCQDNATNIIKRAFNGRREGHWCEPQTIHLDIDVRQQKVVLEGRLEHRWQSTDEICQVYLNASKLKEKDKSVRYAQLAEAWVHHLANNAAGFAEATYATGLEGHFQLQPLTQQEATMQLAVLIAAWHEALAGPAHFAPKAAAGYMQARYKNNDQDAEQAIRKGACDAFMSGYRHFGDDNDAYIKRAFADFDALWQQDGSQFTAWVKRLYDPIEKAISASAQASVSESQAQDGGQI